MFKPLLTIAVVSLVAMPLANAGPAERLERLDNRLTRAEANGAWEQGSRADHFQDRVDRLEDRVDRRESIRDERVDRGPRDVREDIRDRRESRRDRAHKG